MNNYTIIVDFYQLISIYSDYNLIVISITKYNTVTEVNHWW